jgi:hypothetical protein
MQLSPKNSNRFHTTHSHVQHSSNPGGPFAAELTDPSSLAAEVMFQHCAIPRLHANHHHTHEFLSSKNARCNKAHLILTPTMAVSLVVSFHAFPFNPYHPCLTTSFASTSAPYSSAVAVCPLTHAFINAVQLI